MRLSAAALERFDHVPRRDRDRARVLVVPVLVPGVTAMTLDAVILVRRGHEHDAVLLAHELVHVQQWRELGVARFLRRYLCEYLRNRLHGLAHAQAYAAISLEVEARRRA